MSSERTPYRSKTLATWLSIFGGAFGLHRFYLRGLGDVPAWLHIVPTSLGLFGVQRLETFGQDDPLVWVLLPVLGLMISQGMAHAVVYGLTPDERWDARHNPQWPTVSTAWGPVLGVILALMLGAGVLMSSIAYGVQKWFEWQLQPTAAAVPASLSAARSAQDFFSTTPSIRLATSSQRSEIDSSSS
ncbi:MAG: hypothetical protein RLZ83_1719 [Pseudomonadota bacterium]|jgi:hypothetical protein